MNENSVMPPAMILCGGRGTRLRDVTELLPKPMVPIGEQPILWHIMHIYAAFGVRRFILCLGYKRECFIDYFMNFHAHRSDVTITLGSDANRVRFHDNIPEEGWEVTLADTGIDTMTGGRVAIAAKYLRPEEEEFFLTYGDGVADVDVALEANAFGDAAVADVQADNEAFQEHQRASQVRKLRRSAAPASPLRSGWNCVAKSEP